MKENRISITDCQDIILGNETYSENKQQITLKALPNSTVHFQIIIKNYNIDESLHLSKMFFENEQKAKINHRLLKVYKALYVEKDANLIPDALVPIEKLYRINLESYPHQKTQVLWCELNIPANQETGSYVGKIVVYIGGIGYELNIHIEVIKYVLPNISTPIVVRLGSDGLMLGENNYMPSMYRQYVERLLDFHIIPDRMIQYLNVPYVEGVDFTEELSYIQKKEKNAKTFVIPIHINNHKLNQKSLIELLDAVTNLCFKDQKNYFKNAILFYDYFYEETNQEILKTLNDFADKILFENINHSLLKELSFSIRSLKNMRSQSFSLMESNIIMYPHYSFVEDLEKRKTYTMKYPNLWWSMSSYSESMFSYPALDIGTNVASIFKLLINQMKYRVEGLYIWESLMNYQLRWDEELKFNHRVHVKDLYKDLMRHERLGEGLLIYPGKPLGIIGPIDSLRLHYIKEAVELFELYVDLERKNKINAETMRLLIEETNNKDTRKIRNRLFDCVERLIMEDEK